MVQRALSKRIYGFIRLEFGMIQMERTTMKKLLIAGIILLGMIGYAKADAQKVINTLTSAPVKLQNHIQMEVAKAKEYQKNSWADAKAQLLRLKAKFIKN